MFGIGRDTNVDPNTLNAYQRMNCGGKYLEPTEIICLSDISETANKITSDAEAKVASYLVQ